MTEILEQKWSYEECIEYRDMYVKDALDFWARSERGGIKRKWYTDSQRLTAETFASWARLWEARSLTGCQEQGK